MNTLLSLSLSILPAVPPTVLLIVLGFAVFSLTVLSLGALWCYGYGIYAAIDYLIHASSADFSSPEAPDFSPRLTVLKPLCGADAATYSNLLSFCQQDYPDYQIIFAVLSAADPCIEVVQRLIRQFPERDLQLVISNGAVGPNSKIDNLINAARSAKHSLWVIADSDIRVGSDYLQQIVQPFRYPGVGIVTCPYRSQAKGWVATLEALGAATELHPGILMARRIEGVHFALGSTVAIRQDLLTQLGGFEIIADDLADDFQFGRLPATLGYRVVLSNYVVEHELTAHSTWEALQRQIRQARGMCVSRPGSYMGQIITSGTVASLLLGLLGGSIWNWTLLALVWLARLALAWVVGSLCLQDRSTQRYWWLLPIYDLISFSIRLSIWGCALVGHGVGQMAWRGQRFRFLSDGKVQAIADLSGRQQNPQNSQKAYALPTLEEPTLKEI